MSCSGCLNTEPAVKPRRDFLKVGSLGFLRYPPRPALYARPTLRSRRTARRSPAFCCGSKVDRARWTPGIPSRAPRSSRSPRMSPGIQISELLPQVASAWTSWPSCAPCTPGATIIRKARITPSPDMNRIRRCTSPASARSSQRNRSPQRHSANVLAPQWESSRQYEEYFRSGFLGPDYDPMAHPGSQQEEFRGRRSELCRNPSPSAPCTAVRIS